MSHDDPNLEKLANLEHDQWAHWTEYMLTVLEPQLRLARIATRCLSEAEVEARYGHNVGFQELLHDAAASGEAIKRWRRQIQTPYEDLSEGEKASDREWAQKALDILETPDDELPQARSTEAKPAVQSDTLIVMDKENWIRLHASKYARCCCVYPDHCTCFSRPCGVEGWAPDEAWEKAGPPHDLVSVMRGRHTAPKPTAPTSDHNCDDYPESCPRRPSTAAAWAALREYLKETVQVHEVPYFSLSPDGDCDSAPNKCGWAFTICPEDTTSYLREDLSVEWYGTEWEPADASS